jgi:hypothetical protein
LIALINIGRAAMAVWVVYSLLLIFAPAWIHQLPNLKSGIIQFLLAYALGFLMDRGLSLYRRRRAALAQPDMPAEDAGAP